MVLIKKFGSWEIGVKNYVLGWVKKLSNDKIKILSWRSDNYHEQLSGCIKKIVIHKKLVKKLITEKLKSFKCWQPCITKVIINNKRKNLEFQMLAAVYHKGVIH